MSLELPLPTERLVFRHLTKEDLPAFVRYRKQPEVARWQTWDSSFSLADAQRLLQDQGKPGRPDSWLQLALEASASGELVGDVAIHTLPDPRQIELGYTLALEQQGKGYMTEALSGLLDKLFETKHRVTASTDPRNTASIKLLGKLGFRREAHFVKSMWFKGGWVDDYIFAILRDEWLSR